MSTGCLYFNWSLSIPRILPKLTLDVAGDDHDEPAVVVSMVGMVHPGSNFTSANNFLQGYQHKFDGQECDTFVEQV